MTGEAVLLLLSGIGGCVATANLNFHSDVGSDKTTASTYFHLSDSPKVITDSAPYSAIGKIVAYVTQGSASLTLPRNEDGLLTMPAEVSAIITVANICSRPTSPPPISRGATWTFNVRCGPLTWTVSSGEPPKAGRAVRRHFQGAKEKHSGVAALGLDISEGLERFTFGMALQIDFSPTLLQISFSPASGAVWAADTPALTIAQKWKDERANEILAVLKRNSWCNKDFVETPL